MSDDPVRLRDGGSDFLKRALAGARADVPDPSRAEALEAKILPLLVPPVPPPPPPGGVGAAKVAAAAAGKAGLLSFGKATLVGLAAAAVLAGATVGTAIVVSTGGSPAPSGSAVPSVVFVGTAPDASSRAPLPSLAPLASSAPSVEPIAPKPRPQVSASASTVAADPAMEPALLRRAQDALAISPAQAIALCDEHARTYPKGLLGQEREVIAIDALVRAGRRAEAEARAARFAKVYPGSSHKTRIDALLGTK